MMKLSNVMDAEALDALAREDVARALQEDVGAGDLTAGLIDPTRRVRARVLARETAVICGAPWVEAALRALDPAVQTTWHVGEGQRCAPDQVVLEIEGNARALLSAERTALNFLQLLSAVATKTRTYVDIVAGTRAQIVDTRKTIPGLRLAQKYAVRVGGGENHRMGLYDAVMLKENHIRAFGSVAAAIAAARAHHPALPLVVEVETLEQLREALDAGCDRILVDDFDAETRRQAVRIARGAPYGGRIPLEVSGGVDLATVRAIAEDGVDCISIGALTKHVRAIDMSLKLGAPLARPA